jgi:hypothetical protein
VGHPRIREASEAKSDARSSVHRTAHACTDNKKPAENSGCSTIQPVTESRQMGGTGFDQSAISRAISTRASESDAQGDAKTASDPTLSRLIALWSTLPLPLRVELVEAAERAISSNASQTEVEGKAGQVNSALGRHQSPPGSSRRPERQRSPGWPSLRPDHASEEGTAPSC